MRKNQTQTTYDQGLFNTTCSLVKEIASNSYLHFMCEIDATEMDRIRFEAKVNAGLAPSYTAFVVKAAALGLRKHPHLNCMLQRTPWSNRLVPLNNMTATVAVERVVNNVDMVFAPQVKNPNEQSLKELTRQLRHLATVDPDEMPEYTQLLGLTKWARWFPRVTDRMVRLPSLSPKLWKKFRGGSYVVTSPGKYGGCDQVLPPWPWPLTFSFGTVKEGPMVIKGKVEARKIMRLTITADRRLAHGAPLARFAQCIRVLLEHPARIESPPFHSPTISNSSSTKDSNNQARKTEINVHVP